MIDREVESAELGALMARPGPVMALLYGRRRVGKTFLVNHVWPEAQTFYYVASDATGELNRSDFGITYTGPIPGGGVTLSEKVRIVLEIEAVLQAG